MALAAALAVAALTGCQPGSTVTASGSSTSGPTTNGPTAPGAAAGPTGGPVAGHAQPAPGESVQRIRIRGTLPRWGQEHAFQPCFGTPLARDGIAWWITTTAGSGFWQEYRRFPPGTPNSSVTPDTSQAPVLLVALADVRRGGRYGPDGGYSGQITVLSDVEMSVTRCDGYYS